MTAPDVTDAVRPSWEDRWEQGRIGFHLTDVHPALRDFGDRLRLGAEASGERRRVLVPLCGKSVDLAWFHARGAEVTGVELVPRAIESFFAEQQLAAQTAQVGPFPARTHERLTLLCGDVFQLPAAGLPRFDVVYDRAAMVAIPPSALDRYAALIQQQLAPGGQLLLVTLYYDPTQMGGPPWPVSPETVERHYGHLPMTNLQLDEDVLDPEGRFAKRGLTWMRRAVWLIDIPR